MQKELEALAEEANFCKVDFFRGIHSISLQLDGFSITGFIASLLIFCF